MLLDRGPVPGALSSALPPVLLAHERLAFHESRRTQRTPPRAQPASASNAEAGVPNPAEPRPLAPLPAAGSQGQRGLGESVRALSEAAPETGVGSSAGLEGGDAKAERPHLPAGSLDTLSDESTHTPSLTSPKRKLADLSGFNASVYTSTHPHTPRSLPSEQSGRPIPAKLSPIAFPDSPLR